MGKNALIISNHKIVNDFFNKVIIAMRAIRKDGSFCVPRGVAHEADNSRKTKRRGSSC